MTDAEKEELKKYAISCGYKPGATLFGGVNEGKLRCLRNRSEAKIVRTLSKNIGLPKLEADLCRYQRHHIAGSLLYANFKSILLSKVLKMQQDLEDEKNKASIQDLAEKVENYEADLKKKDFTIQDLEIMVKEHEGALEKKDFVIQSIEGSLTEVQAENDSLKNELLKQSEKFEQEKKHLEASLKTEMDKNSNLQKSLKELQEKCLSFGSRCVQRLKDVFYSVGASSAKFIPSAENLPSTLEYIEGEVDALDEVIGGHADFCALVASRGTATAFLKAGCTHGNIVNRPNFSLSASDLIDIPSLARSIGNRFMTQIWVSGGRKMAGDEARSHLKPDDEAEE